MKLQGRLGWQISIADCSTSIAPILDLSGVHGWARCQLGNGINDLSVESQLRKSLTLVSVLIIDTLAIPELDGRLLYNYCSNH